MTKVEPTSCFQSLDGLDQADLTEVDEKFEVIDSDQIQTDEIARYISDGFLKHLTEAGLDNGGNPWFEVAPQPILQPYLQPHQQQHLRQELLPETQLITFRRQITIIGGEQPLEQQQQQRQEQKVDLMRNDLQKRAHQDQQPEKQQLPQPQSEQLLPKPSPDRKKRRKGKLLLWQFLLEDLLKGHTNLSWHEDQRANPGVFLFRDPNQAARRWGSYKENDNMSYEKMSRCIRDYWIRPENRYHQVMVPDPTKGRRLHFAYNLEHKEVQLFVQKRSSDYFQCLVEQGIIRRSQLG